MVWVQVRKDRGAREKKLKTDEWEISKSKSGSLLRNCGIFPAVPLLKLADPRAATLLNMDEPSWEFEGR
jgi:hypothetical protein